MVWYSGRTRRGAAAPLALLVYCKQNRRNLKCAHCPKVLSHISLSPHRRREAAVRVEHRLPNPELRQARLNRSDGNLHFQEWWRWVDIGIEIENCMWNCHYSFNWFSFWPVDVRPIFIQWHPLKSEFLLKNRGRYHKMVLGHHRGIS